MICGAFNMPEGIPDAGEGMCCLGALEDGPTGCTCWIEQYDLEQADPIPGERPLEPKMCTDCAYRANSLEHTGAEHVAGDVDLLERIVVSGDIFNCHQGMRRIQSWLHEPTGTVWSDPSLEAAYAPPIIDGVPFKADGSPGNICAGWAAKRLAYMGEGQ